MSTSANDVCPGAPMKVKNHVERRVVNENIRRELFPDPRNKKSQEVPSGSNEETLCRTGCQQVSNKV